MPINPVTLDKMDSIIIKHIESKMVNRVVHEANGTEIRKEHNNRNNNFNSHKQQQAAEQFGYFLSKFNIKFEYKIIKNRIKIKLRDGKNNILIETEVEDIEDLFKSVRKETGAIIDIKG